MAPFFVLLDKPITMAKDLKRDGTLTNKQIEEELKVKAANGQQGGYVGSQDNGDSKVRSTGTEVQQNDGITADDADDSGE